MSIYNTDDCISKRESLNVLSSGSKQCKIEIISLFYSYVSFKVICMPDVKTLYRVPLLLEENGIFNFLSMRLNLTRKANYDQSFRIKWNDLIER
jgi:CTP synthase (UTP-ammonia lyase)